MSGDRLAPLRWMVAYYSALPPASDLGHLARGMAVLLDLQRSIDTALTRIDPGAEDLPVTVAAALLGLSTVNLRAVETLAAIAQELRPAYEAHNGPGPDEGTEL